MESFITFDDALMTLNRTEATDLEEQQINYLRDMATAAIISYCGQDPRVTEEGEEAQDCAVLGLVAAKLLMQWFPAMTDATTGIESQSFGDISVKFTPDTGFDPFTRQILNRFRKITIA